MIHHLALNLLINNLLITYLNIGAKSYANVRHLIQKARELLVDT